jgi:hypothetical protein
MGIETMAIASLALSALGTGAGVIGQGQQAAAQAGMANYQAQLARNNRQIADWNAQRALQQGQVDEQTQRLKTAAGLGSQRAALAGQGGDVDSGSPLDVQADTARAGDYDARAIRSNAALRAYGYRVQAADAGGAANLDDFRAGSTMAALPFGIGSSLLGGASSLGSRYQGYGRQGYATSPLSLGGTAP